MPHRDKARRRAGTLAWKDKRRPAPVDQVGDLPAIGNIKFSEDGTKVRCHVCGRWYGSLNSHVRTHSMTLDEYREAYGLARTVSLWPPALQDKQRGLALARGQGEVGKLHIPAPAGRAAGIVTRLSSRVASSNARRGNAPRHKPEPDGDLTPDMGGEAFRVVQDAHDTGKRADLTDLTDDEIAARIVGVH